MEETWVDETEMEAALEIADKHTVFFPFVPLQLVFLMVFS